MKRTRFYIILLQIVFIVHGAFIANAYDFEVDGIYYNIFYNIDGNEAIVTYKSDQSYSGDITIPSTVTYNNTSYTVTAIGSAAFHNCIELNSITIPNSVTSIESDAFSGCTNLADINIPSTITNIGAYAFYNTAWYNNQPNGVIYAGLFAYSYKGTILPGTSITLKEGILGIADCAFQNCSGLTSINLPNSVTYIGNYAFHYCTSLADIIIPNSVTSIGDCAFENTAWYNNQPNGLVYAGSVVYKYKGAMPFGTNITIKDGTTGIAFFAFRNCTGLIAIGIPNSVIHIGSYAFSGCTNLTTLNIPQSVSSFGYSPFSSCNSLSSIIVASGNPKYDSRNNCNAIIESSTNRLIVGCKNTIIPNSVTSIGRDAFYGCTGLTSITIPNAVTSIGYCAFRDCSGLNSIIISKLVKSIDRLAFYGCSSIDDIYCFASTPPVCDNYTFSSYSATIHVPLTSIAAYFTTACWKNFENIIGDAVAPTGLTMNMDSAELLVGEQIQLKATVMPVNASINIISWDSTDTTVAIVNDGSVTAVGYGECDILASCFGVQSICHISVPKRIILDQQEVDIHPNQIVTLTSNIPIISGVFMVTSSNPTVAAARIINEKVQVVGINEGTTTITVGSADGTFTPATCFVRVFTNSCDVNCDGEVNIADINVVIDMILSGSTVLIGDVNNDGEVNIADINAIIDIILSH